MSGGRQPIDGLPSLPPRRSGRHSLEVFGTSLWAFLLREMKTQFGRFRLGYFWAIAEPGAVVAVLTILHAFIRGGHSVIYGESPVVFFVFGAVPYFIFMNTVQKGQGAIAQLGGLFSYRQVRPIDVMIARCIIESLMMVSVALVFLIGWWWLGFSLELDDPLLLLFTMFSLFVLGFSVSLSFEVFGTVFNDLRRIFGIIMRPMFFVSGIFFSIEMIPHQYRGYLMWNPVLHGVDLTRDAVMTGYTSPGSLLYLWLCIGGILFVGLAGYRRYMHQLL